jgi:hypothetical protein
MGCDIHVMFQEKRGESWEPISPITYFGRDYASFGALAGIRDSSVYQMYTQRGLPENLLFPHVRGEEINTYIGDHSFSWLTLKELKKIRKKVAKTDKDYQFYTLEDIIDQLGQRAGAEDKLRIVFGFDS